MTDAVRRQISSTTDTVGSETAPCASEDKTAFGKLSSAAIDPMQVIDAYYKRLARWSDEPLRLADFVA